MSDEPIGCQEYDHEPPCAICRFDVGDFLCSECNAPLCTEHMHQCIHCKCTLCPEHKYISQCNGVAETFCRDHRPQKPLVLMINGRWRAVWPNGNIYSRPSLPAAVTQAMAFWRLKRPVEAA
jgi:hypothetical protein